MAWFTKTRKPMAPTDKVSRVPEGLYIKCPGCAQLIYNKDLAANLGVCPRCAHHFKMTATERLAMLFDGEYTAHDADLVSTDPLEFTDTKPYKNRLKASIAATGMKDAVVTATGCLEGIETVIAAMEYTFIGGSMGVVVGEKVTRAIERAIDRRAPVDHRLVLGRRPHDGGRAVADADGQDVGRPGPAGPRRACRSSRC